MLNTLRERLAKLTSADAARGLFIRRAVFELHSCLKARDVLRMEAALLAFERTLAENAPRLAVDRTRAALIGCIDSLLRPQPVTRHND